MKTQHPDSRIIDLLGGTSVVAELCDVKPPSVSGWRINGIPKARLMFLRLAKPEALKPPSNRSGRPNKESANV